jgi:hypothetical protein
MSQDLYKEKYVKYKSKYLSLKNVDGGIVDMLNAGQYCLFMPQGVFNLLAAHSYFHHTFIKPVQQVASKKTQAKTQEPIDSPKIPVEEIVSSLPAPSLQQLIDILNKEALPSFIIKEGETQVKNLKSNEFWTVTLPKPFGQETTNDVKGKTVTSTTDSKLKTDITSIKQSFGGFNDTSKNLQDHTKYKSLLVQINKGSQNIYRNLNPTQQHPLHVIAKDLERTIRSIPSVQ